MAWYNTIGNDGDIVLSSRIRFARNVAGMPFGNRLSDDKAKELIEKVETLLSDKGFEKIDFGKLSPLEAVSYVEKHYVSREFADSKAPHALMLNEPCGYAVMVCEEDHLRLQCILPGLALDEAYSSLCRLDDLVDESFDIAYDENLGYLTHCPTNLGTGMRASVMMFLPALTMAGRISSLASQLSKIGLTIRGLYGEGTAAEGSLYQISNQVTLGLSEEEILKKLEDAVATVIERERALRRAVSGEDAERRADRIHRAEGILRYATLISSEEFFDHFTDIKLGIALGLVTSISDEALNALLIRCLPATLTLGAAKPPESGTARDRLRAELIHNAWEV